jgi:hypothetical protein
MKTVTLDYKENQMLINCLIQYERKIERGLLGTPEGWSHGRNILEYEQVCVKQLMSKLMGE